MDEEIPLGIAVAAPLVWGTAELGAMKELACPSAGTLDAAADDAVGEFDPIATRKNGCAGEASWGEPESLATLMSGPFCP